MSRFPVTGALAATALAFLLSTAHAQYVDVPTFVAGTPTFAPWLQDVDLAVAAHGNIAIVWAEADLSSAGARRTASLRGYIRGTGLRSDLPIASIRAAGPAGR